MIYNKKIKLLLANREYIFTEAITEILNKIEGIEIIGKAESGKELIEKYDELKPDVVLTDISMPEINGIEAVHILKRKDKELKALFLTQYDSEEFIYLAQRVGAKGLISKKTCSEEIVIAIMRIINGGEYFGMKWDERKSQELERIYGADYKTYFYEHVKITEKDEEIIRLICLGMKSDEIAEKCYVSKKAIDVRRSKLMKKLNMKSVSELIKYIFIIRPELLQ